MTYSTALCWFAVQAPLVYLHTCIVGMYLIKFYCTNSTVISLLFSCLFASVCLAVSLSLCSSLRSFLSLHLVVDQLIIRVFVGSTKYLLLIG